jgi:hypothetical protein
MMVSDKAKPFKVSPERKVASYLSSDSIDRLAYTPEGEGRLASSLSLAAFVVECGAQQQSH